MTPRRIEAATPDETDTANAGTLEDAKPPLTHPSSNARVKLTAPPRRHLSLAITRLATHLTRPDSPPRTLTSRPHGPTRVKVQARAGPTL